LNKHNRGVWRILTGTLSIAVKGMGRGKPNVNHQRKKKMVEVANVPADLQKQILASQGSTAQPIKAFFSRSQEPKVPSRSPQKKQVENELSVVEINLVRDGLSRTEARQVAAAMKASLRDGGGQSVANTEHAQQKIGCSVGGHDAKSFLETMSVSHNFQPEELEVLERMWAREDVVIRYGGPPAGLIMKHVDLVRLLDMGGGISGWLNDVIMDFVGCMVNSINIECHVFSTYLRECFLM